jgi:hypothetical protein
MGSALAKPIIFSRGKLMGFASLYQSYALCAFERSETRERQWSRTFVPGFRCAQSGLRNDETA